MSVSWNGPRDKRGPDGARYYDRPRPWWLEPRLPAAAYRALDWAHLYGSEWTHWLVVARRLAPTAGNPAAQERSYHRLLADMRRIGLVVERRSVHSDEGVRLAPASVRAIRAAFDARDEAEAEEKINNKEKATA